MRKLLFALALIVPQLARPDPLFTLAQNTRYLRADSDRYPSRLDSITTLRIPYLRIRANNLYTRDFGASVNDAYNNKLTVGLEVLRFNGLYLSPVYQRQDNTGKPGVNRVGLELDFRFAVGD